MSGKKFFPHFPIKANQNVNKKRSFSSFIQKKRNESKMMIVNKKKKLPWERMAWLGNILYVHLNKPL